MHTGTISFCDRVALNIKSNETKDVILADLDARFRLKVIHKHSFPLDKGNVGQLQLHTHFASLRSNGNPYYMVFTRHEDVPVIYYIDKKILPGYHHPRIILGRGRFAEDLYDNTILDGEMVRKTDGTGWAFLINDIYAYKNKLLETYHLPYRLAYISSILQNEHTPDPIWDKCEFRMKEWYPLAPDTVDTLLALREKLPYTNRGIYFWPSSLRQKPKLFNFDETLIQEVKPKIKEEAIFRCEAGRAVPFAPEGGLPHPSLMNDLRSHVVAEEPHVEKDVTPVEGSKVFWVQKTEFPDVYQVLEPNSRKKVGVAYVGSLQQSRMLHDHFKTVNLVTTIAFDCIYDTERKKWSPLRISH